MCRCNVYEQEQELTCSIAQVTNKASPPPSFGGPEHHWHGSGYSTLGHGSVLLLKLEVR